MKAQLRLQLSYKFKITILFILLCHGTVDKTADGDGSDDGSSDQTTTTVIRNHLYRYELVNNKLVNPRLLLDLPGNPGPAHQGGKVAVGPDNNVYISIGDERPTAFTEPEGKTKAQNYADAVDPDGRAGILRVTPDGQVRFGDCLLFSESKPMIQLQRYA